MSLRGDYEILDLSSIETWKDYFQRIPIEQQDIYFTPEYYKLYEELGDGKAKCFVFKNGTDLALYPFLINSLKGLNYNLDKEYFDIQGAYGYNGVISTTYNNEFRKTFYSAFDEYCRNQNVIAEFTRFHPLLKNHLFSTNNLQVIFDRKTVSLDLSNTYDNIFSGFQTTTRKQIKRATNRFNIDVKLFENDISILDSFCFIYDEAMNRVGSIPYLFFNKTYFQSLIENTPNICFFAYSQGKAIASIIAFYNTYYINGHLGGALTSHLNVSPFSLLYSEMIKFGQMKGCRYLNVGGGATNSPDDPLLKYKRNFSKNEYSFFIGKRLIDRNIYNEVINQWNAKFPEKIDKYRNFLLKYRY